MSCLMIVNVTTNGQNKEGLKKYLTEGPPIAIRYGGKYLVLGGNPQALEGELLGKGVVVSEWADRDAALRFWNSPEYTALRAHREGTGDYQVTIVDTK